MRDKNDNMAYLHDMLDAAKTVTEFVHEKTYEEFQQSKILQSAVERQIEIIGEAANRTSQSFREKHSVIPWKKIIGMRHILAHGYDIIETEILWRTAISRVPELIRQLSPLFIEDIPEDAC